jgi:hypothetical protein
MSAPAIVSSPFGCAEILCNIVRGISSHCPKHYKDSSMKKVLIPALISCGVVLVALLCSFKGDQDNGPLASKLVGTWRTSAEGKDVNGNGEWDAKEHDAIEVVNAATLQFFADGTGTSSGLVGDTTMTITFKWDLQDSGHDIRLISSMMGIVVDTSMKNIVSISPTDFVMRDLNRKPTRYTALKRL